MSYLPEEERDAAETAKWVKKAGRNAVQAPGDLAGEQYCKHLVNRTFQESGKLDVLANVAGFQLTHEKLDEFTPKNSTVFSRPTFTRSWLTRAALPRMRPGNAIVNTASIQAYHPTAMLLPYAATKSAIVSMTKTRSQLGMKQGVRTNAVAPGPVWTPLIPATMPEEKVKEFGKNTFFGRPAQPVEIAAVFVFPASNESRFVTGEVYGVTGGHTPYQPFSAFAPGSRLFRNLICPLWFDSCSQT